MAMRIQFDNSNNVIEPTFVLTTRKGRKIGKLPACEQKIVGRLNSYSEVGFSVYKADCSESLWSKIVDFKLVWVREWNKLFEIYINIDDSDDTKKSIEARSLGEAELSQINLYNIEINTESDISRDDYEPTVLYNSKNPNSSLLTRIMEKAPHYSIKNVDASIASLQRTFTFDNKSIYDSLKEISEEINCLFVINCYFDSNNKLVREINVFDLESYCLVCGERGEFSGKCSNCGSNDIKHGYGNDTTVFVSKENLANGINFSTDNGSVKNCFKLEAGDDLMTATLINCNPNGTPYIWYISDEVKEDMSDELVKRIESYDKDYLYYQNTYPVKLSNSLLNSYNAIVKKYKTYSSDYNEIPSTIIGYSGLMEVYYNTIDFYLFLNNSLMPSVTISSTDAKKEASKLTATSLSPIAVENLSTCSNATADSAVLGMAKTIVNGRYQVKISESTFSNNKWVGSFTITNYSDEEDTATTNKITITINDNYEEYTKQKINKALRQTITEDEITNVTQLFKLSDSEFIAELKKYSLSRLTSFYDNCQSCIDVLIEQGIADKKTWADKSPNLYETLYLPYYNKLGYISAEMKIRESEIATIIGRRDSFGRLLSDGLQTLLDSERNKIQMILDFESYIGKDLLLEFAAYRREDVYKNDNYISDGLNNAELFNNAREFLSVAQKEIYKSATLQHSISATLKNLLVMKEFSPIVDYFEVGNWLRIRVDDKIYKLRLIEYEIDFTDLSNLATVFSDVTSIQDGLTDLDSILNQASSISTSYGSTMRQAKKGSESKSWMDNWVQKGLDATNVKIISNADNQHQTWDSHGMLFREYDSINDKYNDCQLKIINSTLAVTDDNWKTIRTAVGGFYYYDPVTGELTYAYGINAEVLIGKMVLGESLGIYSENNSLTFDRNGLSITNGTNSFVVNPNSEKLLSLSNKKEEVLWADNTGNLNFKGTLQGANGSFTGSVTASNGSNSFVVNPNSDKLLTLSNKSGEIFWADKDGNVNFKGTLHGADGSFTGSVTVSNGTNSFVVNPNSNKLLVISNNKEDILWADNTGNLNFKGTLQGAGGSFTGSVTASNGTNTFVVNPNSEKLLTLSNKSGDVLWADKNGNLTFKGTLTGASGDFTGDITAKGGSIGGFTIGSPGSSISEALYCGGKIGDKTFTGISATNKDWAFWSGNGNFRVTQNGDLYANTGTFGGDVYAKNIKVGDNEGYITTNQIGDHCVTAAKLKDVYITDDEFRATKSRIDQNGEILKQAGLSITADGVLIFAEEGAIGAKIKVESNRIDQAVSEIDEHGKILKQAGLSITKDGVLIFAEDGAIGAKINVERQRINLKADRIELEGYVTADKFSALETLVNNSFNNNLIANYIGANDISATTLGAVSASILSLTVGGKDSVWQKKQVVTSVTMPTFTGTMLNYLDHNGNKQSMWISIRQTEGSVGYDTINYLGSE